jgi:hypothetical protein
MDLREVIIKCGGLFVFIRRDSAMIWGFRYGLTLGIGTLKTNGQHRCFRAYSLYSQTLY